MGVIADQAAAIAAIINAVPDSGVVIDHQPYPMQDWAKFVTTLTTEIGGARQIRAWTIQFINEDRIPKNIATGTTKVQRDLTWLVRGHMSISEGESDLQFRNLIEAVMDAIDAKRTLSGTAQDHDPCDVALPGDGAPVALGDSVVHYCEIRFTGWVQVTIQQV